jgi:hypothetical protein
MFKMLLPINLWITDKEIDCIKFCDEFKIERPNNMIQVEGIVIRAHDNIITYINPTASGWHSTVVHEAVHVAEAIFQIIGEYDPSSEFRAYLTQSIYLQITDQLKPKTAKEVVLEYLNVPVDLKMPSPSLQIMREKKVSWLSFLLHR